MSSALAILPPIPIYDVRRRACAATEAVDRSRRDALSRKQDGRAFRWARPLGRACFAPAASMKEMRGQMKKVAEYRRLALAEIALVETSALANVREKHEVSAARWGDLADQAEQAIAAHLARVRVAPIGLSAASRGLEGEARDLDLLAPDGA